VTGTVAIPNGGSGVLIEAGADANTIGGAAAGERNVLSGNGKRGIDIEANDTMIRGNYIGVDSSGAAALGNNNEGIRIKDGARTVIGGSAIGEGNVVSANDKGIKVDGEPSSDTIIQGNFLGNDGSGAVGLGNDKHGVEIKAGARTLVGGAAAGEGNVISANGQDGIRVDRATAVDTVIRGNFIGSDPTGSVDLGNGNSGIRIRQDVESASIGGVVDGAGNTIAFNGDFGVVLEESAGSGTRINRNRIHSNGDLGIDLGEDGVTANDAGDGDNGENDLQNFPVLTSAVSMLDSTTVQGSLNSTPTTTFRVEFFSSAVGDPSGHGEGQFYLGSDTVTTDGAGNVTFTSVLPVSAVTGHVVTATATNPGASTSEFGPTVAVTVELAMVKRAFDVNGDPIPDGGVAPRGSIVKFLLYINNPGPARTDLSLQDVLDPGFAYLPGTIRIDNSHASCVATACTVAEEASIFATVDAQAVGSDAVDPDAVSYVGATVDAGDQNQGNAQLDINAGSVLALSFSVRMQ
jgi:hypothetical protein